MTGKPPALPRLSVLGETLAVCRLDAGAEAPAWATASGFCSVTRANDELSVVCPAEYVPEDVKCERGWRAIGLEGPLDFSLVGVLAGMLAPLAGAGVPVFALSTFDTDYVLVEEGRLDLAVAALRGRGYEVGEANPDVVVRPAADEERFLWEMLYEAVHREPSEPGPKPPLEVLLAEPILRRYLEGWGRADDFAVIARNPEDGRKIGAAWYRTFPASEPGYGFVDGAKPEIAIAVVPDCRGAGVGGALLHALMDAARSNGFDAMSLSVQKGNHPAVRLYEKNGFVRLRDDGDAWVMKAELDANATTNDAPDARRTEER